MMSRPRHYLIIALVLAIATPAIAGKNSLRVLNRSLEPVVSAFNQHTDRVRFIAILSPT